MAVTRHADAVAPVRSSGPISTWLTRHASSAVGALGRLARHPFSSAMIILVIGVTLALPAAINVIVKNVQAISGGWDNALDFSVFLRDGISEDDADTLANLIEQRADVESVEFISAATALSEFREQSGFGAALDQLPDNPLPHTLVVRPSAGNTSASMVLLEEELANLPEAEHVQIDTEWVQRFHAILDIVRQAIAIGAALLGIAIVVIIGNTIRLDIENRRDEIEVTKLIGASNAFVRRPFLWTGFWYGLFGGRADGAGAGLVRPVPPRSPGVPARRPVPEQYRHRVDEPRGGGRNRRHRCVPGPRGLLVHRRQAYAPHRAPVNYK
ncbi:MAG: permease-like cell division protein FtsX [Woeseiaceae bacterium]